MRHDGRRTAEASRDSLPTHLLNVVRSHRLVCPCSGTIARAIPSAGVALVLDGSPVPPHAQPLAALLCALAAALGIPGGALSVSEADGAPRAVASGGGGAALVFAWPRFGARGADAPFWASEVRLAIFAPRT